MEYKCVIGLEIHVELKTNSKMFCSCKNDPLEKKPNFNICPVCTAQPGVLPVINEEAVRKTIKTGLALNCSIPEKSKFDRKNYFYPDLPKGYQISQYDMPFCEKGCLEVDNKKIRITRVHLEEDTGRLIHEGESSLVDFNRAGIPLMEMVTEPDLNSGQEARRFAEELRLILIYLNVSDADMEKGQMRVEVNISLTKDEKLGTKVEIKNLNSFKSVEKSIDYEIKRQAELLDRGEKIIQETRGWDEKKQKTISQREKEEAHDYRYFPEPDLPTLHFDKEFINKIKAEIPELPWAKKIRFKEEYNLNDKPIEIFINNKDLSEYFEKVMSELRNWVEEIDLEKKVSEQEFLNLTNLAANYIIGDFWALFEQASILEFERRITPENFAELIKMIYKGEISSKIAKQVLKEMFDKKADPSHIVEEKKLVQITDTNEIEKIIKEVINNNPKPVEDYRKGKGNALQYLAGQVMAATQGRAKPETVQEILKEQLKQSNL
ncbi:MAG: glutaminyl-tRNA synthase (glutamine-hydrolyzing) subunit B [Candidatus Nealsonbacteria bacterium RBG_13_37_56]|uniref:Aspartyl/glutamyl-tRNA(Asn/Gln) amidotransferase subunit B n=1 Tax=Candidatus Nealsonbacteria bacterium RBG_13_37_56 TaxID=1801661 RepID=A0A1G2DXE0_9BACT|nr:MAG: glutaminyl-tRNA synthase (glutamine-hydrolyzing) subunit B [Candidatus Nealsonbacteria bacterium RBG_13_37_56]